MEALSGVTSLATTSATEAWSFLLNFLVFIILAGLLFLFSYRFGRSAFLSLIISFYVGFAVYEAFPFAGALGTLATTKFAVAAVDILLYLVFTGIAYYVIRKCSGTILSMGNAAAFILALITAGFLLALAYHTFAIQDVYRFTPAIQAYFAPAQYFFWWFVAPIAGLALFAR